MNKMMSNAKSIAQFQKLNKGLSVKQRIGQGVVSKHLDPLGLMKSPLSESKSTVNAPNPVNQIIALGIERRLSGIQQMIRN